MNSLACLSIRRLTSSIVISTSKPTTSYLPHTLLHHPPTTHSFSTTTITSQLQPRPPKRNASKQLSPSQIRLAKRCSELSLCSRREADAILANNSPSRKFGIFVNGVDYNQFGVGVKVDKDEGDIQVIDLTKKSTSGIRGSSSSSLDLSSPPSVPLPGQSTSPWDYRSKETIVLYKPVGYVSGQPETILHNGRESYKYTPAVSLLTPNSYFAGTGNSNTSEMLDMTSGVFVKSKDFNKGMAPAGRLDIESSGLLIFTRDGVMAKALIGEEGNVEKEYIVRVAKARVRENEGGSGDGGGGGGRFRIGESKNKSDTSMLKLSGLAGSSGTDNSDRGGDLNNMLNLKHLRGEKKALRDVVSCTWINESQFRIVLKEGKKRQVRRMVEEFMGMEVMELKRTRVGPVVMGRMKAGEWRFLSKREGEELLEMGRRRTQERGA